MRPVSHRSDQREASSNGTASTSTAVSAVQHHSCALTAEEGAHNVTMSATTNTSKGGGAMDKRIPKGRLVWGLCLTAAILVGGGAAQAQRQFPTAEVPTSEAAYIAKVKTAAPEQIVSKATITMTRDGKPKQLQAGSNGFTCMVSGDGTPLCSDANGIEWMKAVVAKTPPPDKLGFIYMLAGDT